MDKREIDETDRKIMRVLREDARLTTAQLADAVGLSPTPCWNRVKRLERDGFIEGYVALLNQERLGYPDMAIIEVTLEHHDEETLDHFGKLLTAYSEVLEAYLTTGEYDYLIKVAVAGTSGYERFLRERLYRLPGIRHTRTSFTLRCLKRMVSVLP
jgi:Lrp/AsnC family leucine-responsive transcriptional regulator